MKKIILAALMMSISSVALSAEKNIRGLLGMSQSTVNFGADFEHRIDSLGIGGYFHYASEGKDARKNQAIAIGAMAPAHILDDRNFDVILAPGFGIVMVKGLSPASDETVVGPSLKTGVSYKLNMNMMVGIQHMMVTNWFSDKVAAQFEYTDATITYKF